MALRVVGVKLQAEVSGYMAGLRQAGTATKGLVGEMDRAAKAGKLDDVAHQAAGLGVGLLATAGIATKFAMDFDKQMSAVAAATHAPAGEMEQLRAAALAAGKATSFSATEAAQGIEELSKAGVSTAAILNGGLKGALDLAAAGGLEVAEAAEIAASAMTQFKLDSAQVPHVADLLAAGAGKAQGSVHDLGMALNQAGLVASQMGLSVEDTTGTLAAFASAGMIGSDAGTSLKTAMLMLANPTDKAKSLMEDLGIQVYDASGQFIGITGLAGQLKDRLSGLTQEQRNAALATIFGSDAIRAASILYEQGSSGIQTWIDKTNDSGFAAETARMRMDNLAGDVEKLKGSLETLAIESSTGATSGLRTLVQGADNLVGSLSGIPAPAQNAAIVVAGVTGAALLAGAGVVKMRNATAGALEELRKTGPVGTKAAASLEKTGKVAGRVAITMAALQAASALMGSSVNAQTEVLGKRLDDFAKSGEVGGEAARVFGDDLGKLDQALNDIADTGAWSSFVRGTTGMVEGLTGLGSAYDNSLQHSRERLEALDQTLSQMVQSGQAAQAADIFQKISDRAREQGVSVDELNKVLPGYAAAVEMAGDKSAGAAGGVKEVGASADEAKQKVEDLKTAFDELFGQYMELDEATLRYKQGVVDLTKELTTGKRTLDTDTQAGKDNVEAVLNQVTRIKELRDARIRHGETLDVANGKYVKDIEGLRNSMLQAGFTKKEVDALIGKYKAIPDKVNTDVTAKDKATPTINAIKTRIASINGRTVVIAVKYETHGRAPGEHIIGSGTKLKGLSAGGPVEDAPGPKGVDSRLYALARGEHVLTAAEVDAAGGHAAIERWRAQLRSGLAVVARPAQPAAMPVMAGGGGTLRLELVARVDERADGGLMREISRGIRLEVKNVGGGSVQATYGRNR